MFDTLSDNLSKTFSRLGKNKTLSKEDIEKVLKDIKIALLEADVAVPVVKQFIKNIRVRAESEELSSAIEPDQQMVKIVHEELTILLGQDARPIRFAENKPTVIMLTGLQGVGKTTFAGKLSLWLKEQELKTLLVAADLHRPNAVNQLRVNAEKTSTDIYAPEEGNGVGDPIEVSKLGVEKAFDEQYDVVIVDTAGRLGVDTVMMEQARAIQNSITPDETLLVVDAMMGQNALMTAQAFKDALTLDGILLTKLDGDARGGAALSLRGTVNLPILFTSTGEKMEDLEPFYPERMAGRILDMGDVLTLVEKAEKKFDMEQTAEAVERARRGEFTLEDFITQVEQINKLGSLVKIASFLPGMKDITRQLGELDEKEIARKKAIIYSMTKEERQDYKIIDRDRALRIARGSGGCLEDVEDLLNRFIYSQQTVQKMLGSKRESNRPKPKRD